MNLGDPELELIDPTPNVHSLFIHFDKVFFWTKLASRAVVRWSKRMYSCAGICSYDRGGLCDIALSEPLLKLRPRKDLIETLLHEMIHAFLFITNRDLDRDGHGPNFQAHMHRINKSAGLNISIYHSFHDEVKLYQTHWWRCNGPCQTRRPHFGIVRRTANRAPGPKDYWWEDHKRKCAGTFIKIKEPENQSKKNAKPKGKPNGDISKYVNTTGNIKTINDMTHTSNVVLKDTSNVPARINVKTKSNSSSTVVVTKKGVGFNPTVPKPATPKQTFDGNGHKISGGRSRSNTIDVAETVRNVWANKQLGGANNAIGKSKAVTPNPNKHKSNTIIQSPPAKVKKIDDYFKTTAISVLKDLYGEDFKLTQSNSSNKLVAVSVKVDLVDCPICNIKTNNEEINRHLDECLNKDVIKELSQNNKNVNQIEINANQGDRRILKDIVGPIPSIPTFKSFKVEDSGIRHTVDLTQINTGINTTISKDNYPKMKVLTKHFTIDDCTSLNKVPPINKFNVVKTENSEFIDLTQIKTEKDTNERKKKDFEKRTLTKHNTIDYSTIRNTEPSGTNTRKSDSFITTQRGDTLHTRAEPGTSKDSDVFEQICPCCGKKFDKPVEEHLDECLIFFENNNTVPEEGASTSFLNNTTIVFDDDDDFDESITLNATGTKTPCPCCMKMVEQTDMNDHLDLCLQS